MWVFTVPHVWYAIGGIRTFLSRLNRSFERITKQKKDVVINIFGHSPHFVVFHKAVKCHEAEWQHRSADELARNQSMGFATAQMGPSESVCRRRCLHYSQTEYDGSIFEFWRVTMMIIFYASRLVLNTTAQPQNKYASMHPPSMLFAMQCDEWFFRRIFWLKWKRHLSKILRSSLPNGGTQ